MILKALIFLISMPIFANTFQLQTVEQQIAEADGIMMGHYLRKKSVRLENNTIATQMIFKINREFGLQSDQFGMDEVIVHYPGGRMGQENYIVKGTPEFVSGEKVVLLIQSVQNRYWGLNLAMGAFKQINYGKEIILVNSLVPEDVRVGQIRLDDFEKSVRNIKGSNLKSVSLQSIMTPEQDVARMPASQLQERNRSIASKSDKAETEEAQTGLSAVWLVAVLAFLGGLFRFMRQKYVS